MKRGVFIAILAAVCLSSLTGCIFSGSNSPSTIPSTNSVPQDARVETKPGISARTENETVIPKTSPDRMSSSEHISLPASEEAQAINGAPSKNVTSSVYQSAPSKIPQAGRQAVSWYYMKQKKGVVPRFPAETKSFRPNQKAIWVGKGKKVYLTIDNGGELVEADKMLQVLKDNGVHATFFVTGYNLKKHQDYIRRLVKEGHLVMNHSITHRDFTTLSDEQVKSELAEFERLYTDVTGQQPLKYFRFPYGKYSLHLLDLLSEMGYASVFWSTAMKDWEPRKNGADDAYNDIIGNLHDGNIILMHQGSKDNIEALDRILKEIHKEGYEFVLVTDF